MGTPLDSVLSIPRPLMITVTTLINTLGALPLVDSIAIGNHMFECLACILLAKSF